MTPLQDLDRILKQTMGLDIASIGASALERAVRERQRACRVDDVPAYLERVRASADELQALIESVVVPETWFFRDREVFNALVAFVRDEWIPTHARGCLRLLSLPCSTGEEPYSMAMALLDAQLSPGRFRIDAIDICRPSVERARHAVYGKSSFRGGDMAYRERYFDSAAGEYVLKEPVRRQVDFRQGNVLSAGFLSGTDGYDVIFCRNMLIYFDSETQLRAVSVIERLLRSTGMAFVGSSETGLFLKHPFSSAKVPMAFAFRKESPREGPKRLRHVRESPRRSEPARAGYRSSRHAEDTRPPQQLVSPAAAALKLADEGHFDEAARCCEELLRANGPSAEVFHVLGLVRDASGRADAAAVCYRKALYLEPGHQDALLHLALLMEKQGLKSQADVLLTRARRLASQGGQ